MKKVLLIAIITALIVALTACGTDKNIKDGETAITKNTLIQTVDAEEFSNAMKENPDHLLLDVRTQDEYNSSHLSDSTLIPVQELASRIDEISDWKEKPVFVYCRSGNRSLSASKILKDAGFISIYNLNGGITSWIQKGFEVD
jgi:rhodanese-related sulfurtransferase